SLLPHARRRRSVPRQPRRACWTTQARTPPSSPPRARACWRQWSRRARSTTPPRTTATRRRWPEPCTRVRRSRRASARTTAPACAGSSAAYRFGAEGADRQRPALSALRGRQAREQRPERTPCALPARERRRVDERVADDHEPGPRLRLVERAGGEQLEFGLTPDGEFLLPHHVREGLLVAVRDAVVAARTAWQVDEADE